MLSISIDGDDGFLIFLCEWDKRKRIFQPARALCAKLGWQLADSAQVALGPQFGTELIHLCAEDNQSRALVDVLLEPLLETRRHSCPLPLAQRHEKWHT